jgi:hypothetical protein
LDDLQNGYGGQVFIDPGEKESPQKWFTDTNFSVIQQNNNIPERDFIINEVSQKSFSIPSLSHRSAYNIQ